MASSRTSSTYMRPMQQPRYVNDINAIDDANLAAMSPNLAAMCRGTWCTHQKTTLILIGLGDQVWQ